MVQNVQSVIPENRHLEMGNYDHISESPMHLNYPLRTKRIMECLVSSLSQNMLSESRVEQYFVPDEAAVAAHIMRDLVSMKCLNWTLDQNTDGATVNNANIAPATTIHRHNLDLLAAAASLVTTQRGYSHEVSSLETDFASTFDARPDCHANEKNSGRKIGRIRRYNDRIAAYSAWTDIYAGGGSGDTCTCRYHCKYHF